MINRKELGAVLAVVALAACSDTTGPADQSVPVSLSFIVPGSGSVSPALFAQGLELSDGTGNTLVITSAELVIRDIEFARVEVVDCDTAPNPDACEKFEIGPFLVALPLDGSVSTQLLAEVPTGTYKRIDFDIHKVSDDDPLNADFLARHPSLADISIRVRGTFNGQDYTFWSDLNEEQKIELVSPLVVTPGSLAENVTLTVDLKSWFRAEDGTLYDPATAMQGQSNENAVTDNIRRSIGGSSDRSGGSTDCDVTVTAPGSIQDAVDNVTGERVVCLDDSGGPFAQTVVFDANDSGVTLTAEPGDSPVLDGTGAGAPGIDLLDGVNDVTIEELEIRNYTGTDGHAIRAFDASTSDITVRNNFLHANDLNGVLAGSGGAFIHEDWDVRDNTIADNGSAGVEFSHVLSSEIRENHVTRNGSHGILGRDSDDLDVEENRVTDNTGDGIALTDADDSKIEENQVLRNSGSGISLENSGSSEIEENIVTDNTGDGIALTDADDSKIEENEVLGNDGIGISLTNSANSEIEENTVGPNNMGDGIALVNVNDSKIEKNEVLNNDGNGISLSNSGNNEIEENIVTENTGDGITLVKVNDSKIEKNEATENDGDGISLNDSDNNEIEENTATGNGNFDILQDADSTGNEFEDNTCDSKSNVGTGPIDCGTSGP